MERALTLIMADVIITGEDGSVGSDYYPDVIPYENTDNCYGKVVYGSASKETFGDVSKRKSSQEPILSGNCISLLLSLRNSDKSDTQYGTISQVDV